MKRICILLSLSLLVSLLPAQDHVWVFFTDKGDDAECQLSTPESFLSPEALDRKAVNNIAITTQDLPVAQDYLAQLQYQDIEIISTSRWLNAAVISRDNDLASVMALDFVKGIKTVGVLVQTISGNSAASESIDINALAPSPFMYGRARHQNDMLTISPLHEKGVTGRGVRIAVFDAGFKGADTISVFDSLRTDERLIAAKDFVDNDDEVYHASAHGTQVLSTIAANLPGKMVGMAPHVTVLLARTEDAASETRQEEHNWVKAVEWADSIGVDIIHSSLGYALFDTKAESYEYKNMDGNTTIISRAADMAAARGIIVTVSAGNEGSHPWRHITAPCDADSVLCIGSVDRYTKHSLFSSIGPSADGRVKPDVVAMGSLTTVASPNNRISRSNGTSFSGPLIAGLVACLVEAHPERSNMEIIQAVRLSADQFVFPDEKYGYGIPNATMADSLLANVKDLADVSISMEAKPQRGRVAQAKPQETVLRFEPKYTENPSTMMTQTPKVIKLANAEAPIESIKVMKGRQQIVLDPASLKIAGSGKKAKVKTKYLLPDEYYLVIKLGDKEELIPFKVAE
ncbi:MAG: S8 family serine peptidase [Bacteroidota bacterium]